MSFEGRVALVTGAAHGQGASHARHLARQGARIAALDICRDIPTIYPLGTRAELDATVESIREEGAQAFAIEADVRSVAETRAAVEEVMAAYGRIDFLINNAGACIVEAVDAMSEESLDAIVDVNLKGVFNTMRFVAPAMKEQRYGKVVNTASAGALKALPYASAYCAAKAAVITATRCWARELARWEINVNSISPGTIFTGMTTGLAAQLGLEPDEAYAQFTADHLFRGERGQIAVEDISRMVVFLCGEDARMITGQNYAVDAGWSAG